MAERLAAQELRRFELHHVPYGIDLNRFRFVGRTRSLFGLPVDVPIILFVAWYDSKRTLNLRKGLPDVAEAFETVVIPKIPDAILAVAGESFVPNHPNVRPLGMISQERLPHLLSAANVYVTATLADNLPYTVLEAMACAIPVVATNVGGVPEEVIHGETGLLVPPSNPHKLGAAIVEVLADGDKARTMGANGRRRAESVFSMEQFVNSYERLFAKMSSMRTTGTDG
jgi:glycosyltransferase involved in cell wall biosynthesis